MMEKIDINEVERNLPNGKPSKVRALDSANQSILSSIGALMDERNITSNWAGTPAGISRCTFKSLGIKVGDGIKSVMLIAKFNSYPSYFNGVFGRLFYMRGAVSSSLVCDMVDIICLQAYTSTEFLCRSIKGNDIKVGRCSYMGENYIAIQLGSMSLFDIFFDGVFTNNCVFTQVLESDVTWA